MNRFLANPVSVATFLVLALASRSSLAAGKTSRTDDATPSWKCFDDAHNKDNSLELRLFEGNSTKVEVHHSVFIGMQKLGTLPICTVEGPAADVADGATTVTCHDGAWTDSKRVVLQLGGFLPSIGSATLFAGGPVDEVESAHFTCRQSRD